MPTYDIEDRFKHQYRSLSELERARFQTVRKEFVAALRVWENGGFQGLARFPQHLRVKPVKGHPNIWELTWAPDGRCTWEYGTSVHSDTCHIIWRRIGSHQIFADP